MVLAHASPGEVRPQPSEAAVATWHLQPQSRQQCKALTLPKVCPVWGRPSSASGCFLVCPLPGHTNGETRGSDQHNTPRPQRQGYKMHEGRSRESGPLEACGSSPCSTPHSRFRVLAQYSRCVHASTPRVRPPPLLRTWQPGPAFAPPSEARGRGFASVSASDENSSLFTRLSSKKAAAAPRRLGRGPCCSPRPAPWPPSISGRT